MDEQRGNSGLLPLIMMFLLLWLVFALVSGDGSSSPNGSYNNSYNQYNYTETHNTDIRVCGIVVNGNC